MPDITVWLESTLDIALLVKSKKAAICKKQKIIELSTELKQIRDFGNNNVGFPYTVNLVVFARF